MSLKPLSRCVCGLTALGSVVLLVIVMGCSSSTADQALWQALAAGDVRGVEQAVAQGAKLDATRDGKTPLRFAFVRRDKECFTKLLDLGAKPEAVSPDGHIVTHLASMESDAFWLESILRAGADPNQMNGAAEQSTGTPLAFAVSSQTGEANERVENVRLLIQHGADVNKPADFRRRMPIQLACSAAHFETVLVLLASGADFNSPNLKEETFIDLFRDMTPDLHSYDRRIAESCGRVWKWFEDNGYDLKGATWNGKVWDVPRRRKP
jgi:hypothetical protein